MQFISAQPLIEQFRSGDFDDDEVQPYFIVSTLLAVLALSLVSNSITAWGLFVCLGELILNYFGLLRLKSINNGTYGNQFLQKWFVLGWVATCRILLISIPVAIVWIGGAALFGAAASAFAGVVMGFAFTIGFYWHLGELFRQALADDALAAVAPRAELAN